MKKPVFKAGFLLAGLAAMAVIIQPIVAHAQTSSFLLGNIEVIKEYVTKTQLEDKKGEVLGTVDAATEAPQVQEVVVEPQPVIVEVAKGDSLSKIATTHNTTFKRLYDANAFIADPNIINPGDKVRVPSDDEIIAERALPTPKPVVVAKPKTAAPSSPVVSTAPAVAGGSVWDQLARCESGGNWSINTGNGYYGGLQFSAATWRAVGGSGLPHQNSREEQIHRAEILLARSGWGQWPACTKKLGLR